MLVCLLLPSPSGWGDLSSELSQVADLTGTGAVSREAQLQLQLAPRADRIRFIDSFIRPDRTIIEAGRGEGNWADSQRLAARPTDSTV